MARWKNDTLRCVIARSLDARAADAVACLKPGGGRDGSSSTVSFLSSSNSATGVPTGDEPP